MENSLLIGIEEYGKNKEIIACMHYPPIEKEKINNEFTKVLKKYNVKTCVYGHLHGKAHENAIEGNIDNVNYKLVSCDYTNFKLIQLYA